VRCGGCAPACARLRASDAGRARPIGPPGRPGKMVFADIAAQPRVSPGGMLGKPLRDARHVLLEVAGGRDVEHPGPPWAAVLEVVGHVPRHQDERPGARLDPFRADQHAHGAGEDVEHVVLRVRVRARALGVRVEPPLRDRIPLRGLRTVGLEDRRNATHRIRPALAWSQHHRRPAGGVPAVGHHRSFPRPSGRCHGHRPDEPRPGAQDRWGLRTGPGPAAARPGSGIRPRRTPPAASHW
jgi:hypothetical protein